MSLIRDEQSEAQVTVGVTRSPSVIAAFIDRHLWLAIGSLILMGPLSTLDSLTDDAEARAALRLRGGCESIHDYL